MTTPSDISVNANRLIVLWMRCGDVRSVGGVRRAGSRTACRPLWPGFRSMCRPAGLLPWRGPEEARPLAGSESGMPATDPWPELKRKELADGGSDDRGGPV
jgi:hypothetical protein